MSLDPPSSVASGILVHRVGTQMFLAEERWPEHAEFSHALLMERPPRIRFHNGMVKLTFDNGLAVYALGEKDALGIYTGTLRYYEGPYDPETK